MSNRLRLEIKQGLDKLNSDHILFFKRMYSHNDLSAHIDDVIDNIDESKLEHVLFQVDNTIAKYV